MRRGTTPILTFDVPFAVDNVKALNIAFSQCGEVILEKELADCVIQETSLAVKLSQADTLKLKGWEYVDIQIRAVMQDDSATASDIIRTFVEDILKDGEIK